VIEVLKSFEQEASRFQPMILVVPGLAMVALGLIAWLAGMCLRRLVLALAGAAIWGIAGWLLGGPNPAVWAPAAGGGAVFGAILPRLSTAILLAAFGVAVAFAVTTKAHLAQGQGTPSGAPDAARGEERLTVPESFRAVRIRVFDIVGRVKAATADLEPVSLAVIAVSGLVLLMLGLLFARLAGALAFSVLGAWLIFAGLIALLIFKGSAPIVFIQKQGAFYGLVLLGMMAFGTLEQLLLCPSPQRRHKVKSGSPRPRQEEPEHGWRDH
jgi:hypothetical protein